MEPENEEITIRRQCELLELTRSVWYYQPKPEDPEDLRLMNLMDEQYLKTPFYGVPRMTEWLRKNHGMQVNPKRVRRLLRKMGLREDSHQHGRTRPGSGQHLRGAFVAERQIRGSLSARLRHSARGGPGAEELL